MVTPDGPGFRIAVVLDKPVPAELEGRAGLNLEFRPSQYWEHTYLVDGRPGIFPRYPAGPSASLPPEKKIPQFEGFSTFDLHGHTDYVEAQPIAAGKTLVMAPEDPERFVTIRSLSGDLQLLDGRNLAQNGWFVVRTLLATKTTGKVAEWYVEPHTIPGWIAHARHRLLAGGLSPVAAEAGRDRAGPERHAARRRPRSSRSGPTARKSRS